MDYTNFRSTDPRVMWVQGWAMFLLGVVLCIIGAGIGVTPIFVIGLIVILSSFLGLAIAMMKYFLGIGYEEEPQE